MVLSANACAVVPASSPFKTLQDLIDYGKANPGKLTYASAGNGSSGHPASELLKGVGKFDALHVPDAFCLALSGSYIIYKTRHGRVAGVAFWPARNRRPRERGRPSQPYGIPQA
jgi:hypothetical protein